MILSSCFRPCMMLIVSRLHSDKKSWFRTYKHSQVTQMHKQFDLWCISIQPCFEPWTGRFSHNTHHIFQVNDLLLRVYSVEHDRSATWKNCKFEGRTIRPQGNFANFWKCISIQSVQLTSLFRHRHFCMERLPGPYDSSHWNSNCYNSSAVARHCRLV